MRAIIGIFFALSLAVLVAAQTPSFRPVANNRELMLEIIIPSSNAIFAFQADETSNDETSWAAVRHNALLLAESANLLMIPGRAKDAGDWAQYSQEMAEAGVEAIKAADARDGKAVLAASDKILESCASCHKKYMAP